MNVNEEALDLCAIYLINTIRFRCFQVSRQCAINYKLSVWQLLFTFCVLFYVFEQRVLYAGDYMILFQVERVEFGVCLYCICF